MDLATLTLFLPACFALNMAPGPNNLLSVSNSTRYGYRTACLAGVGRLLAFAAMIALASAGLAVVLQTSELLFYGIKILGAAYLFYLAWQLWRADPGVDNVVTGAPVGMLALARQEFLVAAGNPKAHPDLHRVPAAVCRRHSRHHAAIRCTGCVVPDARMDRLRGLRLHGSALAPLVRQAVGQAVVQSLLRGPVVGRRCGAADGAARVGSA